MIKSIFFRALTLLGLTFVLIGCGAADPGEGGTGTPGTGPVTQADLEKMEETIKDMIQDAKGAVNTSSGHAVAMKAISILKASQPNSCSFFGVDGLAGTADANDTIVTIKSVAKYLPYTVGGGEGKGGTFEIKVEKTAGVAASAASSGKLAKDALLTYEYKMFSIDGKYFIDGTLVMKNTEEASAAGDTKKLKVEDGKNTLKLYEGKMEIATITFGTEAEFTIVNADCAKITDKAYKAEIAILPAKTKVTVTATAPATFEPVEMSVSSIAVTKLNRTQGKNIEMLWALLGPKNPVEIDAA